VGLRSCCIFLGSLAVSAISRTCDDGHSTCRWQNRSDCGERALHPRVGIATNEAVLCARLDIRIALDRRPQCGCSTHLRTTGSIHAVFPSPVASAASEQLTSHPWPLPTLPSSRRRCPNRSSGDSRCRHADRIWIGALRSTNTRGRVRRRGAKWLRSVD